jgi:hypothetical protein
MLHDGLVRIATSTGREWKVGVKDVLCIEIPSRGARGKDLFLGTRSFAKSPRVDPIERSKGISESPYLKITIGRKIS